MDTTEDGLQALIFTADGDMRQAINNLQSTYYGFKQVNAENVFKVCDQPHPVVVRHILESCSKGDIMESDKCMRELYDLGYASLDIITTIFRVIKSFNELDEELRLDYLKEIGMTHMRILDGHQSLVQLSGLVARLCKIGKEKNINNTR